MRGTLRINSDPEKKYFTAQDVGEELKVSKGLVFYISGKLNLGTRDGKGKHPRRFSKKEIEKIKAELDDLCQYDI